MKPVRFLFKKNERERAMAVSQTAALPRRKMLGTLTLANLAKSLRSKNLIAATNKIDQAMMSRTRGRFTFSASYGASSPWNLAFWVRYLVTYQNEEQQGRTAIYKKAWVNMTRVSQGIVHALKLSLANNYARWLEKRWEWFPRSVAICVAGRTLVNSVCQKATLLCLARIIYRIKTCLQFWYCRHYHLV